MNAAHNERRLDPKEEKLTNSIPNQKQKKAFK